MNCRERSHWIDRIGKVQNSWYYNKIEKGLSARALRLKGQIQALSSRWEFRLNLFVR